MSRGRHNVQLTDGRQAGQEDGCYLEMCSDCQLLNAQQIGYKILEIYAGCLLLYGEILTES